MSSDPILLNSTEYNYDYFQQDNVCRLCWNRNANIPIDNIENDLYPIKNGLLDKITDCLDIMLSSSMPNKVCNECCTQINKFYNFKKSCQETDRKLRDILQNHNIDVKVEKVEEIQDISLIETHMQSDNSDCEKLPKINRKFEYKNYRTKCLRSPTYCNICMVDCETSEKLKSHNLLYHGIDNGSYKCFGCDKMFKTRKNRFCHEKNFCKGLKDGFKCNICDRFLPNRRIFEFHMRDHRHNVEIKLPDKLFQCHKCEKLFKTRENMFNHLDKMHVTKKNYVCESCGRTFTRADYLRKHKLTHTGEKLHVCPHCGFRTIQRSSLIIHIRKHTGERPYTCSICPQTCVSSSNLRAHLQRHMGLKMHECTICNKKFSHKVSLREHVTSHAASQHECTHCSAVYTNPRALRRHVAAKHNVQSNQLASESSAE